MNNIPNRIDSDLAALPGGVRQVPSPEVAMPATDGLVYYAAALLFTFFIGFGCALLAVGFANRVAGRAPVVQPALLEPPTMIVQPLCKKGADEGCP